ncbi:MAG TPA: glycosyltransferase, partial [Phycisphaerae bacterium]|nr:glycosyltransferase [Phycisphaerae bacterium]
MRVLTLGWDFPPVLSGGVGTACLGLTRALTAAGAKITFVLPRCPDTLMEHVEFVGLGQDPAAITDPHRLRIVARSPEEPGDAVVDTPANPQPAAVFSGYTLTGMPAVEFVEIDAMLWPYRRPGEWAVHWVEENLAAFVESQRPTDPAALPAGPPPRRRVHPPEPPNFDDLFREVDRYAELALQSVAGRKFDVIHAHDWMTFPAARAVAEHTGRPFVVHIHSTEFDRSGHRIDQRIYDIERAGLDRADHIIAVSYMTRRILMSRYGVPADKITVVYNAVAQNGTAKAASTLPPAIRRDEKIVLFLGRITVQKGPEYFLAAARKVLDVYQNVRFVMAGSGDMARSMIELAAQMGIGHRVLFTGFLRGDDVRKVFRMADLYVMPSVSEPFGIAPLEALANNVPVLISKQSGVAEVLTHA